MAEEDTAWYQPTRRQKLTAMALLRKGNEREKKMERKLETHNSRKGAARSCFQHMCRSSFSSRHRQQLGAACHTSMTLSPVEGD